MRIAFGIYAGSELWNVPPGYLYWVLRHVAVSKVMRDEIEVILQTSNYLNKGDEVMPLGKYAGFRFDEIPLDYLTWILANIDFCNATRNKIRAVLAEANYPEDGHLRPPWMLRGYKPKEVDDDRPA